MQFGKSFADRIRYQWFSIRSHDLIGIASGITSKPANEDHFKTGQRN